MANGLVRLQLRRGTAAEWAAANPVLHEGEPGYEVDTGLFKIGDGLTAWNDLLHQGGRFVNALLIWDEEAGAYPERTLDGPVIFHGPENPDTLGLMEEGDAWLNSNPDDLDAPSYLTVSDLEDPESAASSALNTAIDEAVDPIDTRVTALEAGGAAAVDLLTNAFTYPVWAAHRSGGGAVFPKQSIDAMGAAFRSGFIAEVDVYNLADSETFVMCHDGTVTRTMTGITGNVQDKTRDEWAAGRLKPILTNGHKERAPFWEDALAAWGGRGIIMAELKYAPGFMEKFAATIKRRNLQGSIIACNGSLPNAGHLASLGLYSCVVSDSLAPADIAAAGVKMVASSASASQAYIESVVAAGLVSCVYGITSAATAATRVTWGAKVLMADDPWYVSGKYEALDKDPLADLKGWPGLQVADPAKTRYEPQPDGSVALHLLGGNGAVRIPWTGPVPRGSRIFTTWKHTAIGTALTSARHYFNVGKNLLGSGNEHIETDFYLVLIRRNGTVQAYRKVGGVTTELAGAGSANPIFDNLPDSTAGTDQRVQIDLTTTGIEVTNLATGAVRTFADASHAGPFTHSVSMGGGTVESQARHIMRKDI